MANNTSLMKKEVIDVVEAKIKQFQNDGELHFPENYSPQNALKAAWLVIQETKDRNDKPVLDVCTKTSIGNALLAMVISGLNPYKKQCYFIAYGNKLLCQPSYFGNEHIAKTVEPDIIDVYGKTVYADDEFEYEIKHGKEIVTLHKQKLANIQRDKIVAAYGTILYRDGREHSTVMTFDQIKEAWRKSPTKPFDDNGNLKPNSTHYKFTADMSEKTAINKVCKYVINSSDDKSIVARYARMMDSEIKEAEVDAEIEEKANREIIDIEADYEVMPEGEQSGDPVKQEQKPEEKPKDKPGEKASDGQQNMFEEGPGN